MKKSRSLKSWSKRDFPDDLCPEILSWLPVKALVRFQCVSKPWRALINDPDFARLHLTRFNRKRHESPLLVVQGKFPGECVIRRQKDLRSTDKLCFLESDLDSIDTLRTLPSNGVVELWGIISSIDGLVMLKSWGIKYGYKNPHLIVWNPSIRKTLILPPSPEITNELILLEFGLGFDALGDDYKYVRMMQEIDTHIVQSLAIYSLGTNSWKKIEFRGKEISRWRQYFQFDCQKRSICFRSAIYGLARYHYRGPLELVSFDLSCEMFSSTRLPVEDDIVNSSQALTITDDGCSLSLVSLSPTEGSVWVLQSLGADFKSSSWTQRYTFTTIIPIQDISAMKTKFLYLKRNGELLLKRRCKVTSYDLKSHEEKDILKKNLDTAWPYLESLILLTQNRNA